MTDTVASSRLASSARPTFQSRSRSVRCAQRIALRYELAGFVRNTPAGGVQMLVQGLAEDIDDCLRDISESFSGYIRDTKIEAAEASSEYNEFKITF